MITYKRADNVEELKQILRLQQQNLPENLSPETIRKDGFVTVKHDLELLTRMNDACAHFIATHREQVVGYSLCMHPEFRDEIDILRPMFDQIEENYAKDDYVVMGQICVSKKYRRKGIFKSLYKHMLRGIQPEFSTIITEVDLENTISLNAHYAAGFKPLCEYSSDDHNWILIKLEAP